MEDRNLEHIDTKESCFTCRFYREKESDCKKTTPILIKTVSVPEYKQKSVSTLNGSKTVDTLNILSETTDYIYEYDNIESTDYCKKYKRCKNVVFFKSYVDTPCEAFGKPYYELKGPYYVKREDGFKIVKDLNKYYKYNKLTMEQTYKEDLFERRIENLNKE